MFQYTNTIVLNSLKDVTTGLDKIVKGSDNIEVRRVNKFLKKNVSAMHKELLPTQLLVRQGSLLLTQAQVSIG